MPKTDPHVERAERALAALSCTHQAFLPEPLGMCADCPICVRTILTDLRREVRQECLTVGEDVCTTYVQSEDDSYAANWSGANEVVKRLRALAEEESP